MTGILGSGAPLLLELSNSVFNETMTAFFRRRSIFTCQHPAGLWFEDAVIYGAARKVSMVQVSGDPPHQAEDAPMPEIPFASLETGEFKRIFSFTLWPFMRGFSQHADRMTAATGAVAVAYGLADAEIASFDAFQTNALTVYGIPRDYTMTCRLGDLAGVFIHSVSDGPIFEMSGAMIPFLVGPEPVINQVESVSSGPGADADGWSNPISILVRIEVTIGSDTTTLNVPIFITLELGPEPGSLLARVRVPPNQFDVDVLDTIALSGFFPQDERDATAAKLTFVVAKGIANNFDLGGFLGVGAPNPIEHVRLGEATIRLMDERYTHARSGPDNGEHPRISCDGWFIDQGTMTLFGRVLRDLPGAPRLVAVPNPVSFIETQASGCAALDPPAFDPVRVDLRNTGAGPLYICIDNVTITGPSAGDFTFSFSRANANDYDDIEIPAGSVAALTLTYSGPRGAPLSHLNLPTNDPQAPLLKIPLQVWGAQRSGFSVSPGLLQIERANNPMGGPLIRINNCEPVPARMNAGEFTVTNVGVGVLFVCSLQLIDPDDVFDIVFVPRKLTPGQTAYFGVDFFPKEAGRTYYATCRLGFSGGQTFDLPIEGRVSLLPQPGGPSDWIDINTGQGCITLDNLCISRGFFEPVRDPAVLPVVEMSISGLPQDAELIMRDGMGRTHVHDRSSRPDRWHSLAYTPNPDGGPMPGDPCRGEISGGPGHAIGPFGVDIAAWLIQPHGDVLPLDRPNDAVFSDGFLYAPGARNIVVFDAREDRVTKAEIGTAGRVDRLAVRSDRMAIVLEDRLALHNAAPGKLGGLRADIRLEHSTSAVALLGPHVVVAHDGGLSVFEQEGKRLKKIGQASLPGPVLAMQISGKGVAALLAGLLAIVEIGRTGDARIGSTLRLAGPAQALSRDRRGVVLHSERGALLFDVDGAKLKAAAEYPLGHWSAAFLAGRHDGILFRRIGGGVQRHRATAHGIDRNKFAKAVELQYRPKRPKKP